MKLDRRRKRTLKSLVLKQSVSIHGHNSSVTLEAAFWNALKEIAVAQNISANALISKIDSERDATNLSSAIRVYVLEHYRLAANASEPHLRALQENAPHRSAGPKAVDWRTRVSIW